MSIDKEIVEKVRKIAMDKDTTLSAMVSDYLSSVANSDDAKSGAVKKEQMRD